MKKPPKDKSFPTYDHAKIEPKWQKKWAKSKIYKTKEKKGADKFYILDMFPYPSGEGLHVGHPKGYIATDVISRMNRMMGKNVLHPMGFDAFGLPAENYALKTRTHPEIAVKKNVARYKKQLEILGFDYDWSREVNTTDPAYYKWTQWIFLKLLEKGLAFESYEPINWCPSCKTGLANEDIEDGRCERCGTPVEKKPLRQWVLRITDYAERLLADLEAVDGNGKKLIDWPNSIKELQKNWIGKSEGAEIDFLLESKSKPRVLLLHGFEGSPKRNFIPWLKKELELRGHVVDAPELPNAFGPDESEQVNYVLENCRIDENTLVIGHSLGSIVALKAIMKKNVPISGLVLVAPALDPKFENGESEIREYAQRFKWDFDYELIRKLTSNKIAILSDLLEKQRIDYLRFLSNNLSALLVETEAKEEHFCADEEPTILDVITPKVKVFTTRPDTLYGVTYVVLAPEHEWVGELLPKLENKAEVEAYIARAKNETETERTDATKEKTGVQLKGVYAINPVNNEKVPVWISDYVLADYGTGAVMAVPAHDERDYAFAKKFGLPIKDVIVPHRIDVKNPPVPGKKTVTRRNVHAIVRDPETGNFIALKWKKQPWTTFPMGGIDDGEDAITAAMREVTEETGYTDLINGKVIGAPVYAEYFAAHKDENRVSITELVTFDLGSKKRNELTAEESDKHEVFWAKPEDMNYGFLVHAEMDVWLERLNNPPHAFTEQGKLINSGSFDGRDSSSVMKEITTAAGGKWVNTYKLRDWVFSRQRYWGEPIPVIHCEKCGVVPVPEKDLPVKLPKVKSYEPTGTGESPLAGIDKWVNTKCPRCKGKARRETNTMPQWAGSSWYYIAYCISENLKSKASISKLLRTRKIRNKIDHWLPVDFYVGGAEHATRHLIYARFWHKFLFDIGAVTTVEPFSKLQHVGLIMGEDGRKMSKRFGNVVNPDDIVARFGADTMRVYEMFMGPFDQQIAWSTDSMVGARRFIERIWRLGARVMNNELGIKNNENETEDRKVATLIHKTIKKVTEDIQSMKFNTAISSLMITVNELENAPKISSATYSTVVQLIAPFAPHMADELWSLLGNKKSVHLSQWPTYDPALLVDDVVTIAIQVNGKVRGSIQIAKGSDETAVKRAVEANADISKWIEGKKLKKCIYVPDRLMNMVVLDK